jgi:hypothetical protein
MSYEPWKDYYQPGACQSYYVEALSVPEYFATLFYWVLEVQVTKVINYRRTGAANKRPGPLSK